ncbi:putative protein kinase RLK-Pelle-L-LEC family [Rosa chinensis]|uniref:Protein kinase domain-containing protein n=1 Tax=Rosa chinensis TaxID=74649 RepID=A0A2P6SK21_ROSCH|nr:putative protein kinase RLK-Pelle-L-LEC family [Rosa chinensis]
MPGLAIETSKKNFGLRPKRLPTPFWNPGYVPEEEDFDLAICNGVSRRSVKLVEVIDQLYTSLLAYRAGQGTYVEPLIMPSSFPDSGAPLALLDDYDTLMSVSEGVVFTLWCLQFNKITTFVVSQFQIVTVEFGMTFSNKGRNPPEPHIGIDINTLSSNTGNLSKLWITCNATGDNVRLAFWTYEELQVFVGKSSLSYHMDLKQALPQQVKIGFSASTGMPPEGHVINDWELNSTLVSDKCTKNNERHTMVIAIFAASFSVLILAVAICLMVLRKPMNRTVGHGSYTRNVSSINTDLERLIWPRRFAYEELAAATNGFANETRLGQGGTGQVYKGVIHHLGCDVAIKRIFAQFEHKHYEKIFINEVKIISRLIHRNVVQFIGWCHEQDECLLVYAFMPNNSLDTHLFGCGEALPWDFRYKIALGLASALHYLHEDAGQCAS